MSRQRSALSPLETPTHNWVTAILVIGRKNRKNLVIGGEKALLRDHGHAVQTLRGRHMTTPAANQRQDGHMSTEETGWREINYQSQSTDEKMESTFVN